MFAPRSSQAIVHVKKTGVLEDTDGPRSVPGGDVQIEQALLSDWTDAHEDLQAVERWREMIECSRFLRGNECDALCIPRTVADRRYNSAGAS